MEKIDFDTVSTSKLAFSELISFLAEYSHRHRHRGLCGLCRSFYRIANHAPPPSAELHFSPLARVSLCHSSTLCSLITATPASPRARAGQGTARWLCNGFTEGESVKEFRVEWSGVPRCVVGCLAPPRTHWLGWCSPIARRVPCAPHHARSRTSPYDNDEYWRLIGLPGR